MSNEIESRDIESEEILDNYKERKNLKYWKGRIRLLIQTFTIHDKSLLIAGKLPDGDDYNEFVRKERLDHLIGGGIVHQHLDEHGRVKTITPMKDRHKKNVKMP